MKVTDHIAAAEGKTLFSFEILPPLKGTRIDELFGTIERLMAFGPKFVDVTSHREDFIYKKREMASWRRCTPASVQEPWAFVRPSKTNSKSTPSPT